MGLHLGGLKSGINFELEPEWAYIWVDLHPGGPLFGILRYSNSFITIAYNQTLGNETQ